ncbi:hypothetical protein J2752_000632 [Halarchaeum rubridurum]|uniref:Uncharacterized protein n=1 Tax=Halarchaeum rubridurum TaxID=489911 RepID=A0A830FWT4_9EURY|nr:hypothetical protein [Halarchaeum rubridurum]MBP1953751.1 hypothetical protein [Halarchaeum rubridurum]GGM54371.1 hypothetical protein GCM10009017_00910 [Halarchaeum rubridurum]
MTDVDPVDVDWDDPQECPWCGADIADGGAGFMDHIEANPECEEAFEAWRENVADDVGGEWMA